jgi:hypothetical protein
MSRELRVEIERLGELAQELALLHGVGVDRDPRRGVDLRRLLRRLDRLGELVDGRRIGELALEPAARFGIDAGLQQGGRDPGPLRFVHAAVGGRRRHHGAREQQRVVLARLRRVEGRGAGERRDLCRRRRRIGARAGTACPGLVVPEGLVGEPADDREPPSAAMPRAIPRPLGERSSSPAMLISAASARPGSWR